MDGRSALLSGFPASAVWRVKKLFHQHGIETSLGSRVVDCDDLGPSALILENGERIRADLVVWATGAAAPTALRGFDRWRIRTVPRAQNARADALVNAALDGSARETGA